MYSNLIEPVYLHLSMHHCLGIIKSKKLFKTCKWLVKFGIFTLFKYEKDNIFYSLIV